MLGQLVVALVYNLAAGVEQADVRFFRFGDVPMDKILVEPHFIIQRGSLPETNGPLHQNIEEVLVPFESSQDFDVLFNTPVKQHMRWRTKP